MSWHVFTFKNDLEKAVIKYRLKQLGYYIADDLNFNVFSIKTYIPDVYTTSSTVVHVLKNKGSYEGHQLGNLRQLLLTKDLKYIGSYTL